MPIDYKSEMPLTRQFLSRFECNVPGSICNGNEKEMTIISCLNETVYVSLPKPNSSKFVEMIISMYFTSINPSSTVYECPSEHENKESIEKIMIYSSVMYNVQCTHNTYQLYALL